MSRIGIRKIIATCAVTALGLSVAACGNQTTTAETDQANTSPHSTDLTEVLPSQQQIRSTEPFAYLMADPSVQDFTADGWATSPGRTAATLEAEASPDPTLAEQVNQQCGAYEEVALGLISTPNAPFTFEDGKRRRINLGQAGINQITGYNSVVRTDSAQAAEDLLEKFSNNTTECANALNSYYPTKQGRFDLRPTTVDHKSGVVTLRGMYNGDLILVSLAQHGQYLVSTWFRALDPQGVSLMDEAGHVIESLTLDNLQRLN
ncbi:hypothetical protein VVR12_09980 [Rothia sp. LK2588]|uniref:hypothetical protein n=1 Tax=Rothia sp. LK2588 TaxID=3114369 RepID=UPI0034CEBBBD